MDHVLKKRTFYYEICDRCVLLLVSFSFSVTHFTRCVSITFALGDLPTSLLTANRAETIYETNTVVLHVHIIHVFLIACC